MAGTPTNIPAVLVIRDGWGENPHPEHDAFNAVRLARTPVADRLRDQWPTTLIRTSGEDVGLPDGTMGNSEVGHQNIGAGRVVDQELMRITGAVRDGSFRANPVLRGAFDHARAAGGQVHLLGLASDGLVHSDLEHLFALIGLAADLSFDPGRLVVHALTDGRDTTPTGGLDYVERIEARLRSAGVGRIGSVIGRYYAMDRDERWERVARAHACLTGIHEDRPERAVRTGPSATEAVEHYYAHPTDESRRGDEFIVPTRIAAVADGPPDRVMSNTIGPGDAVIFFNFRGDRPRELTKAFVFADDAWTKIPGGGFDRGPVLDDLYFCTMSEYQDGLPVRVAFPRPPKLTGLLGGYASELGLAQLRCAETEKFPHVTFFFNDYREEAFPREERVLVPSPRDVATYGRKPDMSARAVCAAVVESLRKDDPPPLVIVNFANADMVGHTGVLAAAVRAVEVVDECTGLLVDTVLDHGGSLIVTADHGNAEQMWQPAAECPHTAHTVYDVPLHVAGAAFRRASLRADGRLGDIAPTLLHMMNLEPPAEMTGTTLLA